MKKILTGLLVALLVLWIPYFVQTYNLKTLTASDLPAEGSWASLKEGNQYYRWYYPDTEIAKKRNSRFGAWIFYSSLCLGWNEGFFVGCRLLNPSV